MRPTDDVMSTVDGRVEEVFPQLGLAFVLDDGSRSWGVTRCTPGSQFAALTVGCRVRLRFQVHQTFSVVREYKVLD